LQAHLRLCDPQHASEQTPSPLAPPAKSALSEFLARAAAQAEATGAAGGGGDAPAVARKEEPQQLDVIMEDRELEEGMEIRGFSPPPRGCSPDLSRPFFFHARNCPLPFPHPKLPT